MLCKPDADFRLLSWCSPKQPFERGAAFGRLADDGTSCELAGAKTKTQAVHQALQDTLDSIPERHRLQDIVKLLRGCVSKLGAANLDFDMNAFTDDIAHTTCLRPLYFD